MNFPSENIPEHIPQDSGIFAPNTDTTSPLHEGAPHSPLETQERKSVTGNTSDRQEQPSNMFTASLLPKESSIPTYAVGSAAIAEAGILARLGWIARVKDLYAAIPAYKSASIPFAGLFSGMRPGSVSVSTLVPPLFFRRRRKHKNNSPDTLLS